jgi:hypothetical protein
VWVAAECVLAVASLVLRAPWQRAAVIGSAVLGLYVILRIVALAVFERLQRSFEQEWITTQTGILRQHAFDVVRFTVQDNSSVPYLRRCYNLASPADVRDLLQRQERERASQPRSRATVEFSYLADRGMLAIAQVRRDLAELAFLQGQAGAGRASVRFPQAYYVRRLMRGPAQRAYWTLSGEVMVAVSEPAYDLGSAAVSGLGSAR